MARKQARKRTLRRLGALTSFLDTQLKLERIKPVGRRRRRPRNRPPLRWTLSLRHLGVTMALSVLAPQMSTSYFDVVRMRATSFENNFRNYPHRIKIALSRTCLMCFIMSELKTKLFNSFPGYLLGDCMLICGEGAERCQV